MGRLRRHILLYAVIAITILAIFGYKFFVRTEFIDIRGRLRQQWSIAGVKLRETEADTWMSRVMAHQGKADWRIARTAYYGNRNSPHYRFHGAISQIRMLEILDQMGALTPAGRREACQKVLKSWQDNQ